jgi:hypothetical protein
MSAINSTRRVAALAATALRPAAVRPVFAAAARPGAAFSTTQPACKTVIENVKDGARVVDRAVSDKLVDGISVAGKKEAAEDIVSLPRCKHQY